jgi:hypothetical protein
MDRRVWNESINAGDAQEGCASKSMSRTAASQPARSAESWGMANVRLIKHEAVPKCGSFEVCFPDGRPSKYFY